MGGIFMQKTAVKPIFRLSTKNLLTNQQVFGIIKVVDLSTSIIASKWRNA